MLTIAFPHSLVLIQIANNVLIMTMFQFFIVGNAWKPDCIRVFCIFHMGVCIVTTLTENAEENVRCTESTEK